MADIAGGQLSTEQEQRNLPRCVKRDIAGAFAFFFPLRSAPWVILVHDGCWGPIASDEFIADWRPTTDMGRRTWEAHIKRHPELREAS